MKRRTRAAHFVRELLFPRRCPFCDETLGFAARCDNCAAELLRHACPRGAALSELTHELSHLAAVYTPFYYEDVVRHAILRMKFSDRPDLAASFASFQAAAVCAAQEPHPWNAVCFVPSSRGELRKRGYDVPELLARELGYLLDLPVLAALCKKRETQRQMTLSGQQRRRNLKGAITASPETSVRGLHLLLVDDVVTTGSTMNECAKALLSAGAASCTGVGIAAVRTGV